MIVGRMAEQKRLERVLASQEAEFIAVYGRRRVGKTYLIRQFFQADLCFELSGQLGGTLREHLTHFASALATAKGEDQRGVIPKNWQEAFHQLTRFLDSLPKPKKGRKRVIFFDEVPWLASRRSRFLMGLDHFWNSWASRYPHIVLVICGSSTSWMIEKVLRDRGGLHNRVTARLRLEPFDLSETEHYLQTRGLRYTQRQVLELYMIMGGVPHYLKELRPDISLTQNIDKIAFTRNGLLRDEFDQLYAALFDKPERHVMIIRTLAKKRTGMTRGELLMTLKETDGGRFTKILSELEESGFIMRASSFAHPKSRSIYYLADEYSAFYLRWIAPTDSPKTGGTWQKKQSESNWKAWSGFAFGTICLKHVAMIKQALGIPGVHTEESSWRYHSNDPSEPGAQIDLVIDRGDECIHLCEIKFSDTPFVITKAYAENLRHKMETFRRRTGTKKSLFLTFITLHGVKKNDWSLELVTHSIDGEPLFVAHPSRDESLI
jgi:AAA+ ATPase superfamily predicted ATPase